MATLDIRQEEQQRRQALLGSTGPRGGPVEARQLQQPMPAVDGFFASDPGLITVFDFDYDAIIDFKTKMGWAMFLFTPPAWITTLCCTPCFINQNVMWTARAQHVALTVDGIRYVVDRHKTLCGLPCSDKGKESKTVPYDKITDCDVQEPAGTACCCCIQRTLAQVNVDTASSGQKVEGGGQSHELALVGLRYPNEFKQAVWSMKRGEAPAAAHIPMAAGGAQSSHLVNAPAQASMTNSLLIEIRDELKELNANLKAKA